MSSRVSDQVKINTPAEIVTMIETQLARAAEAGDRVAREGSVVRDMKGSVIPHPAIAVEAAAQKMAAGLLKEWANPTYKRPHPVAPPAKRPTITNDGKRIRTTDYWEGELCAAGEPFASLHDGCLRVLLPESISDNFASVKCEYAIVTRGPMQKAGVSDAFEIVLEDGSDDPACFYVLATNCIGWQEVKGCKTVSLWSRSGIILETSARSRTADHLPCLDPWDPS